VKKLINDPESVVRDGLTGFALAHPELTVSQDPRYVTRGATSGKVGLVSGGGSGHEPLHAGFVGVGMLDAACPGEVFTSPVPDQILAAIRSVDGGVGVLLIVKNYTGDVLNFKLAAELAADEGITTATVLVDDDTAVQNSTWTAGRRGTRATVLVEKLCGALAARGADLVAVGTLGQHVNEVSRSFAVALSPCTVPAAGKPGFELGPDEIEIGVGIHGEPGRERGSMRPARDIAALAVDAVLAESPLTTGGDTFVLVSGMGGTPLLELYGYFASVAELLAGRGVRVARSLVGNYVTSLEMAGAMLTVCEADPEFVELWDAPVATPALRWGV
jgi:phosphoenolpyruvate---glycerone phosphotransferase subunit DhaK